MSDGQAFGLSVTVRHTEGRGLNLTNLVKTVFDGAIASFHAHSGPIADQVRASLATTLQIAPSEVDARLLDQQRAILGARRLVWPFGRDGIQWNPADDRCLAGELLSVRTDRGEWRLSGALFELKPASV